MVAFYLASLRFRKFKFQIIAPFVLAHAADLCKAMRLATSMLYYGYMDHVITYKNCVGKWKTFLSLGKKFQHTSHKWFIQDVSPDMPLASSVGKNQKEYRRQYSVIYLLGNPQRNVGDWLTQTKQTGYHSNVQHSNGYVSTTTNHS